MSGAIVDILREDIEGVDVLTLDGEVDLTNADVLQEAVEATTAPAVVLDLTRLAYLDSSGIRAIDRGNRLLAAEQRQLLIVSPPHTAADWTFRVAGLSDDMRRGSLDAALAAALASAHRR
ncbi:MAG TPA: STAS domain-containing protein [Gaiella sp.]|uniref:STAS domain-containing protein n=1 Tax=Gaiella sp. TaxID=2663207 RepID=UPI002D7E999F|nr:STAS domain-containing protein [Gaiella sp.]HET9287497.1 STAS domain-containing protein [Gaiella sp.]